MAVCTLLPDRLVKSWSEKGREEALGLFQKSYKAQKTNFCETNIELRSLVYDLLKCGLSGSIGNDEISSFLGELVSVLGIQESFPSLLADTLTVLDADVGTIDSKEQRSSFKALLLACRELVGELLLKERLDMDTLEVANLVPSKTNFNQKYVKTKTKLFYKQPKYNLFREENEGYSKLIAELGHDRRLEISHTALLDHIKSLIGRFNLDPNRVLDVMLEAFETHLEEEDFFLPLLDGYPCDRATFVNILGFKFQTCQGVDSSKAIITPPSLYSLAAKLLHHGLVTLDELYPHLSLSDVKLKEFYESVMQDAKNMERKANVISLADKTDEEKVKEVEEQKGKQCNRETVLSLGLNQKLGVLYALLEHGDWPIALQMLDLLPPYMAMWSVPIVKSLCRLVHTSVAPLYKCCAPKAAKGYSPSPTKGVQLVLKHEDMERCHVFEMLYRLGPHIHRDPLLHVKILRIVRAFMKDYYLLPSGELHTQDQEDVFDGLISVLDEVILPALSFMQCNCGMAEEVWSVLKLLPYQTRYCLYGHWKNDSYDQHPELMEVRTQTLSKGKYIMKRLTKDNVKPSGRQIGKLSHTNPGIIFDYVLSQIQKYDNFIIPVVDSLKYLTPLAYDVLAYCIIEALGNPQKEKLKHEDTNISTWLQGLANFSANVFKKYQIELTGLLQYVINQLKAGKSFDLLVLKEVVQKMAGIDISEEMTTAQLEAMAGGELLKAEGGYFSQVRNTKKSSQRLREALVDTDLSLPLCLLMAQQRDCIVYKEASNRHLKLVCNLLDHCMDTFVQFGLFLSTHLSAEEYSMWVPSLTVLGQEYHIPPDAVFFMLRPLISNSVTVKFLEAEKSSKMDDKVDKKTRASQTEANFCSASQEVMEPLIEASKLLFPPRIWEDISPRLFATFWSLSLYDLYVPNGRYEEEIGKAKVSIQSVEDNSDLNSSSKRKKEQDRGQTLIEKLQEEKQRQEDNCRLVLARLRQDKESWFSPKVTKNRTITQFLQLCIFPRCRFTAIDALYCGKFVLTLHTLHVSNFSTLLFFDRIFSDISYTVACCTENEVRRYGRFLGQLLEITTRWHSSEAIYLQECSQTPGFISMMKTSANEKQYLDYENFRHITFKWHFKLTKSLVVCLESKDYMQIRNGLIVLTRILPYYPKVYHLSLALEKRVEKIMEEEKEKRADLYTLATGYAGMLKTHRVHLVAEAEFHNREERVKAQNLESESKTPFKGQDDGTLDFKEEKLSVTSKARLSDSPRSTDDGGRSSSKSKQVPDESKPVVKEVVKESTPSSSAPLKEKDKEKTKLVKSEGKEPPAKKEKKEVDAKLPSKETLQTLNGSEQSSPPGGKAGQRRQHSSESSTSENIVERDLKRRRTEDGSKSKLAETPKDKTVSDGVEPLGKEKVVRHERKRDRSADQDEQRGAEKDSIVTKRRKESPEPSQQLPLPPTVSDELVTKERKLKVMVAKKDIHNVKLPPSPRLPKTVVKKDEDDKITVKKEKEENVTKDDERLISKKDDERLISKKDDERLISKKEDEKVASKKEEEKIAKKN